MAISNVMNTGNTGMVAAKAGIATTGHNITNATTEGFSRQQVKQSSAVTRNSLGSKGYTGNGTTVARIDRVNDAYIEKRIRNGAKDLAHFEEKDVMLRQVEDIFNEMGGEGMNRILANFFNEFRKLANEPDNEAVRQTVREGAQAVVNDFKRLRESVKDVTNHVDARIEGATREINAYAEEIRHLNIEINKYELGGASANDLRDKRDLALKKLGEYMDLNMHQDSHGNFVVDIKNVGPLVIGPNAEKFSVMRSPADKDGKPEGSYSLHSSSSANGNVTHTIKGGKLGALLEVRDKSVSTVLQKLDDLAYGLATAVNQIHSQGVTRDGMTGVNFFKAPPTRDRAAEFLELSDAVKENVNAIATAAEPDSPSDNRIALAITGLQSAKFMNNGKTSIDDFYNSIVTDVGVAANSNKSSLNQQKDIVTQLGKFREQISGVSIDEETTNLLQYQQAFAASAKVIQVADEMLQTVLNIKR